MRFLYFRHYFFLLAVVLCIVGTSASPAFAQASDTFLVRSMVGNDTTPPSIPAGLVATPIAYSQIDLSWATSTDDFAVGGYHVWRDGILVATTTSTLYSDTGLSPSTSYTYVVTAFDITGNESASSTSAVAQTFGVPTPQQTESEGGTHTGMPAELMSFQIIPSQQSATLHYTTRNPVRVVVRYGTGVGYELGSLHEQGFQKMHTTFINGLQPDTVYQVSVEGELGTGRYGIIYMGSFRTLPNDDVFPPGNVTHLHAVQDGSDIVLSWNNPGDADFDHVRVVRNSLFYPTHSTDGWVVYEGGRESVDDTHAARADGIVYYTVFTYDTKGNVSSGAIVAVTIGTSTVPVTTGTSTASSSITLTFEQVQFLQEWKVLTVHEGRVAVDGAKPLTVSVPYALLPEHLKTIILEVRNPFDTTERAQYLLRVDDAFTAYTATLAPFGVSGEFPVGLTVFDVATQNLGYVTGTLSAYLVSPQLEQREVSLFTFIHARLFLFLLSLILLILLAIILARRSQK